MELEDKPIISTAAGIFLILSVVVAYVWVAYFEGVYPTPLTFFIFSIGALVGGILVRWVIEIENEEQKKELDATLVIIEKLKEINFEVTKRSDEDREVLGWLVNEAKKIKE